MMRWPRGPLAIEEDVFSVTALAFELQAARNESEPERNRCRDPPEHRETRKLFCLAH
jgi:hypothetical protein